MRIILFCSGFHLIECHCRLIDFNILVHFRQLSFHEVLTFTLSYLWSAPTPSSWFLYPLDIFLLVFDRAEAQRPDLHCSCPRPWICQIHKDLCFLLEGGNIYTQNSFPWRLIIKWKKKKLFVLLFWYKLYFGVNKEPQKTKGSSSVFVFVFKLFFTEEFQLVFVDQKER